MGMKLKIKPCNANYDKMHGKQRNSEALLLSQCIQYFSASGASQGSIDNRIEQAMDLVKSHLMSAVRSEVEELRDKISKLEETVTILSRENEVLRANVAPEVLASLTGGVRLLGIQGGQGGQPGDAVQNPTNNNQH